MNRDAFILENPLEIVLKRRGVEVKGEGNQRTCLCPFHKDSAASMSVNVIKGVWFCHACDTGGSVIDLLAKLDHISPGEVLKRNGNAITAQIRPQVKVSNGEQKFETVATYDYHNALGEMVYQVVRQHAASKDKSSGYVKTFLQRQPDSKGGWVYKMDGVERVLYRLPEVLKSKTVWIVEGEKDADTLDGIGICATCNVGGAGKWMDAYADDLSKKRVVICGDNDEPGQKHMKAVFHSLVGKAKECRVVQVPETYKDVTDFINSFPDKVKGKQALLTLADQSVPFVRGTSLPIYKLSELEPMYMRHVERMKECSFELKQWLPGLSEIRPLVPGELVLILGATGIGKTAALSNIAKCAFPTPLILFELELPAELMYERLISLKTGISCRDVEAAYRQGDALGEDAVDKKLSHVHICTQSRLSVKDFESMVIKSELKIGERPKIVLIDYIGLVQSTGKSRYERVSQVAEDLKVMAKVTQTVVIVASQVGRSDENEIGLTDGKDSGSLENSSGLVLGMWRETPASPTPGFSTIHVKVLKSTKGGAGTQIACDYNLNTLAITEKGEYPGRTPYAD